MGRGASLQAVPNNNYRLRRVMEILVQTGRPLKQLDLDITAQLDYDFRCFFLNRPRVQLFRRIDQRCCDMLAGGLLQVAHPQELTGGFAGHGLVSFRIWQYAMVHAGQT